LAGIYEKPDSKDDVNRVLSTGFFSFCAAALVFLAAGLAMTPFIPGWFKMPPAESEVVILTSRLAILAGAIGLPLSTFGAVVVATQHMAVNNIIRNVVTLLSLGLTIGLLYAGVGLPSLALANLFNFGVKGIANYFCARRYCPYMKIRFAIINREDFVRLWTFGGYFQLARLANIVTTSAGPLVIAASLGASSVTPYALTSKLATLFSIGIASKLGIAVFPALSQMFANREEDNIRRVFITLVHYSVRLAIVGGVFLAVANRRFISLWVGEEMFGGFVLNAVFVCWVFQNSILSSVGVVVKAYGKLRNWAFATIVEAAITVTASVLLVRPFGLSGVAIGICLARALTMVYIILWICTKLGLPVYLFAWRGMFFPVLRSLLGCVCVVVLALLTSENHLGWFWIAGVGLISLGLNVVSFEGVRFFHMSNQPWTKRIHQMVTRPMETIL
jgi:O-antigen/teichoic acid export membrane protein